MIKNTFSGFFLVLLKSWIVVTQSNHLKEAVLTSTHILFLAKVGTNVKRFHIKNQRTNGPVNAHLTSVSCFSIIFQI